MIDNREPARRKSKWAEAHLSQKQEVDHVVGRDMSENKTTTDASCVLKTSSSVENANTISEKEEMTVMDQELDKRIKNLQTIMETNQKQISDNIRIIYTYLSKENNNKDNEINDLRVETRHNKYILKDFDDIKNKLNTYRKLFWGVVGSLISIAFIVLTLKAFWI